MDGRSGQGEDFESSTTHLYVGFFGGFRKKYMPFSVLKVAYSWGKEMKKKAPAEIKSMTSELSRIS